MHQIDQETLKDVLLHTYEGCVHNRLAFTHKHLLIYLRELSYVWRNKQVLNLSVFWKVHRLVIFWNSLSVSLHQKRKFAEIICIPFCKRMCFLPSHNSWHLALIFVVFFSFFLFFFLIILFSDDKDDQEILVFENGCNITMRKMITATTTPSGACHLV